MKVVALSDTHGKHRDVDVPDADLLIFAGDMSFSGDKDDIVSFNQWLGALPHRHKLVTAGNHDWCLLNERNHYLITNAQLLLHEAVEIEGVKIFVSPSARRFSDRSAFALESAKEAREHWSVVPPDIDILVTHGPPQGILDIDEEVTGDKPQGCPILRDWVEAYKPPIHIFGHIHRSAGVFKTAETIFVNCSIASDGEHKTMNNKPRSFTIR